MDEKFKLIIDYREKFLIDELKKMGIDFIIDNLSVGDIIIKDVKDNKPVIMWERKTTSDLECSMKDGRYHEQKSRILKLDCIRKGYILESSNKLNNKELGFYSNTCMRDKLFVIRTFNINETAKYILTNLKNIEKYNLCKSSESSESSESNESNESNIKTGETLENLVKKKSNNKHKFYLDVLCLIPGISTVIANEIIKKYNNINDLISVITGFENEEEVIKNFLDFKINNRKISNKVKLNLYHYFSQRETNNIPNEESNN